MSKSRGKRRASEVHVAKGRGKIRPRARLLRTIGADLISSEIVAIIELVRNSYDADASAVELVFERPEDPAVGQIVLQDNGHGMSRAVLLGPWLEPATDHKALGNKRGTGGELSPRGRRRLGSKGVGRFAAQRLGGHLMVWTKEKGADSEREAEFDWKVLDEGRYLDEVRIPWWERTATNRRASGTRLTISGLHDRWTPDRFDRLKLGLARLINPTVREDFRISIVINGAKEEIRPALDSEQAMYSLTGVVEVGGACRLKYRDVNGDDESWDRTVIWPEAGNCGPFEFEINAWDLDSHALRYFFTKTGYDHGLLNFRRALRDHSGVSLYRDGFRVLPYGEPDNDWLRLDRRRVNNPTMRLSNNQVLGHIQLTAAANPELRDQTNREGLVTNEAYAHLQEIVLELLQFLEVRRFSARRSMGLGTQRRASSLPEVDDVDRTERLDFLIDTLARSGQDQATEIRRMFSELRDVAFDSVRHYAGLASTGHMAGLVFRQLSHPLRQIRSELALAAEELRTPMASGQERSDALASLQQAIQHADTMVVRMSQLDPLAFGGRGRRVARIDLDDALAPVIRAFEEEGDRFGVTISYVGRCGVVSTNREVAQHALANLLDNAIWWAAKTPSGSPHVVVKTTSTGFSVADNGPGVDKKHRELVFEPGFSTKEEAHGLGLTLVRELLATIGGSVTLTKLRPATFSVELTEAQ
ncbi:MAG: sensor histidine kinase [Gemmatimonadales bacterium]